MPLRLTLVTRNSAPKASEAVVRCNNSIGAPASTSAPISISPLMPAKHSRYPIRISLFCKAGQHLDGQDLVHRPRAVSFAIERDVTESGSANYRSHRLHLAHLEDSGHFLLRNLDARNRPVMAHPEALKSQSAKRIFGLFDHAQRQRGHPPAILHARRKARRSGLIPNPQLRPLRQLTDIRFAETCLCQ